MRRWLALLAVAGFFVFGTACSRRHTDVDALRSILARSELQSRSFVYEEKTAQTDTVVQGAVAVRHPVHRA